MGFIESSTNTKLTTKLTEKGRLSLLNGDNAFVKFMVGDSDANYLEPLILTDGNVPSVSGLIGDNNVVNNSVNDRYTIKSNVYLNDLNQIYKDINQEDTTNISSYNKINSKSLNLSQVNIIELDRTVSDEYNNLAKSFGLPITTNDYTLYQSTTFNQGGFSNTAIADFINDDVTIIEIPNSQHSNVIDGKKIHLNLSGSTYEYNIYSTYQTSSLQLIDLDNKLQEPNNISSRFGDNIAFLFSDEVEPPLGGGSWASGYNSTKPFSQGGKKTFRFSSQDNIVDKCVGIAFLDKGFIVILNEDINIDLDINDLVLELNYNNYSNTVSKNINIFLNRGEFFKSNNKSFSVSDTVRISEIAICDNDDNIMAIAKPNKHIEKQINQLLGFSIEIIV